MDQEYLVKKKTLQKTFLEYLDNQSNCEENYENLICLVNDQKIKNDENEFRLFLRLLDTVSNNHFRTKDFFSKIEKIIIFFKEEFNKHLTDDDIFTIFSFNKRILLFLIENDILHLNRYLSHELTTHKIEYYDIYFYDEINKYFTIDSEKIDDESFQTKRRIGENDQEICKIIRDDMISEFIIYVNKNELPLETEITQSIYETNPFLYDKTPSLIEYSAFFGSIQIFKYLFKNGVELSSSLWLYSIHGAHPEIIKILEDKNVKPEDETYNDCILEAIQCHQNDLVHYLDSDIHDDFIYDVEAFIEFYNFEFFTEQFYNQNNFFYFCKFDYYFLVKYYLMNHDFDINFTVMNTDNIDSLILTPLLVSVLYDNYNIVELLLKHPNIDINFKVLSKNWENNTFKSNAIFHAILNNNVKMLKLLLTNEKINVNDKIENITLEESETIYEINSILKEIVLNTEIDSIEFMKLLLSHQNIDINMYDEYKVISNDKSNLIYNNTTILKDIIEIENIEMLKLLLKHPKIDVNIPLIFSDEKEKTIFTPLCYAISHKKIEIVKLLLSHLSIDVNAPLNITMHDSKKQMTPLTIAIKKGQIEIVDLLLSHPKIDVNAPEILYDNNIKLKNPPLNLAIDSCNQKAAILLLSHHNIDVNIKTIKKTNNNELFKKEELSSLYFAIKNNDFKVIQLLLSKQNTNFNNKTMVFTKNNFYNEETTALQYAVLNQNDDSNANIIEFILDCMLKSRNLKDDLNELIKMSPNENIKSVIYKYINKQS